MRISAYIATTLLFSGLMLIPVSFGPGFFVCERGDRSNEGWCVSCSENNNNTVKVTTRK